jgi:hypothetical protein
LRELEKPIGRVWRRMRLQRFLSALVWCWVATLALAAVAIAAQKAVDLLELIRHPSLAGTALTMIGDTLYRDLWAGATWWPFAIAGGAGLVVAALVALTTGPSRVDAAVAIDRVFHLNERLSTALTLPQDLRETPAGRALLADAIRHAATIEIDSQFGPRFPRRAWVPLIPAALALGLVFLPEMTQVRAVGKPSDKTEKQVITDQSKALSKKIASQRKDIDKSKFAETEKLLAQIEKAADDLAKAPPAQKDKALVELNKLTDTLKERQKNLGSPEQMNRQLQQLKDMASSGPADDFAKALSKGDFPKAMNELKQLQEKLKSGKMNEAEKKALQQQLGEMAKQLEKLANLDERRKQLEEAKKNGGLTKEQFDKEMAKLDEQSKQLQKLQQMATKLAEAEKQMQKGDSKMAAKAMGECQKQLSEMANGLQELEALEGAMAELQDAKNGMTGDNLNQLGESLGQFGMDRANRMGNNSGLGRGRGRGDRPEAPEETATYKTKVKQQFGKGKAVLEGFTPNNSNDKGKSVIDIQGEIETSEGLTADALTNQKIPRNVEKHIRGYFDQINKGK